MRKTEIYQKRLVNKEIKLSMKKVEIIKKWKRYNYHFLTQFGYYEKNITQDGNCYYKFLSFYFRDAENYHLYFRKLISEIFEIISNPILRRIL